MSGKVFDPNFLKTDKIATENVDWYEVTFEKFDIRGLIYEENQVLTRRMPTEVAKQVSEGVLGQSGYGAGGRVLFASNSDIVALKVEYAEGSVPTVCNHCLSYGFDLYRFDETNKKDVFVGAFRPANGFEYRTAEFKVKTLNNGETTCYTLNMPHFAEVKSLFIGFRKGSLLTKGKNYRNDKPVVFYGSSITHGAAAGRPGNTYENFISQKYNLDYVNLGFAGRAKGERVMAEYISTLEMCAFVCDYDHNAPTAEHLRATHYPFYKIIREKHPNIPYIMISMPDFFNNPTYNAKRREAIIESYNKAKDNGDKNVYFIDGETLFEGEFYESCTNDGVHPNDIGFYRMATKIGDVIASVLNLK